MTTAPSGHRAVPKTWTSIKVISAPPRSHRTPRPTPKNPTNKAHTRPMKAPVHVVRDPRRLPVRSSIKKTNTMPKHSAHSVKPNKQIHTKDAAAKFEKRTARCAVARPDRISKPRDVRVNILDNVNVSPSSVSHGKIATIGAKGVAEVKSAQPRDIPNAHYVQVGSSTGVPASQRNAKVDAGQVNEVRNHGKAVHERRVAVGNDDGQCCKRDAELTPEQEKMARENERCLQQEIDYIEQISRKLVSEDWKKWSKWYAQHVQTTSDTHSREHAKKGPEPFLTSPIDASRKANGVDSKQQAGSCAVGVGSKTNVKQHSLRVPESPESRDVRKAAQESTAVVESKVVNQSPSGPKFTSGQENTTRGEQRCEKQHQVGHHIGVSYQTNHEGIVADSDSVLTPEQERNARMNELSLEFEMAYLESISRKNIFASKYFWAKTYPRQSIDEVCEEARGPEFFQNRFNCGPCGNETWPKTFDEPAESIELDTAINDICSRPETHVSARFQIPHNCNANSEPAWNASAQNRRVTRTGFSATLNSAVQEIEPHLAFLFQCRYHCGPMDTPLWPVAVRENVMYDV